MVARRSCDRRDLRQGQRRQQLVGRAARRVDVATGSMHDLLAPSFQIDDPQWSPDGSRIAVIGGIMSDFGSTGGDLYLVDAQTRRVARPDRRRPVFGAVAALERRLQLRPRRARFGVDAACCGSTLPTERASTLLEPIARNRCGAGRARAEATTVALVRASFDDPPEVWAGPPAALRQITHEQSPVRHALRQGRFAGSGRDDGSQRSRMARSIRWSSIASSHLPDGDDDSRRPIGGHRARFRQP